MPFIKFTFRLAFGLCTMVKWYLLTLANYLTQTYLLGLAEICLTPIRHSNTVCVIRVVWRRSTRNFQRVRCGYKSIYAFIGNSFSTPVRWSQLNKYTYFEEAQISPSKLLSVLDICFESGESVCDFIREINPVINWVNKSMPMNPIYVCFGFWQKWIYGKRIGFQKIHFKSILKFVLWESNGKCVVLCKELERESGILGIVQHRFSNALRKAVWVFDPKT